MVRIYNLTFQVASVSCEASNAMVGWSCLDNEQKNV